MKILYIIGRLNVGGPARHVVWLADALREGEFNSILLAGSIPTGEEDMTYYADQHHVEPIYIEEMSRELAIKDLISLWKIFWLIRKVKPDIIDTHTAKAGTIGRAAGFLYRWLTPSILVARPRKVAIIHTFHGHVFHSYYGKFKTGVFIMIERFLARFATNKIVVISKQQSDEIQDRFNIGKASQFEIVPYGLDLEPFTRWRATRGQFRKSLGADENDVLIGLVGRLTEIKNHNMILEVARRHLEEDPINAARLRILIIGDGHMRRTLESKAEVLGVGGIVEFLGNRNDPEVFYAGLDIVALTSLNEGTPFALIEAMACERPIISTMVGGVQDLVGEITDRGKGFHVCERGIAVESGNTEGFYDGLMHLCRNNELRADLTESGKTFVYTNYSKARMIAEMKDLYRSLIVE